MHDVVKEIAQLKDLRVGRGIDELSISHAEKKLKLHFNKEYKTFLRHYGLLTANGITLNGINCTNEINIVHQTIINRPKLRLSETDYVIENDINDTYFVIQNTKGTVFFVSHSVSFYVPSLYDYIKLFV